MCHRAEILLPCQPASVARARHWIVDQLAQSYGRLQPVIDDIELVASELVTNCVRADAGQFSIAIESHHSRVRTEVTDDGPGVPIRQRPPPDTAGGRGLMIVDALSRRWGVRPFPGGKTVWAEFAIPAGALPSFDCALRG